MTDRKLKKGTAKPAVKRDRSGSIFVTLTPELRAQLDARRDALNTGRVGPRWTSPSLVAAVVEAYLTGAAMP